MNESESVRELFESQTQNQPGKSHESTPGAQAAARLLESTRTVVRRGIEHLEKLSAERRAKYNAD